MSINWNEQFENLLKLKGLDQLSDHAEPVPGCAKQIGMEKARVNLTEMVLRVRYRNERYVIEKHGVPLALVIPIRSIPTLAVVEQFAAASSQEDAGSAAAAPVSPMSKLKVFEAKR